MRDAVVSSFVPATAAAGVDMALYDKLLSSRDGLLFLRGSTRDDLSLCNPMMGECTFLPDAGFQACTYVLLTGYDLPASDGGSDGLAVRVLAVEGEDMVAGMTYQLFFATFGAAGAGAWGVVKRTLELNYYLKPRMDGSSEVICGGAVHWPVLSTTKWRFTSTVAIDVRTGRTWTMELPEQCQTTIFSYSARNEYSSLALATSRDDRLSAMVMSFIWAISSKCGSSSAVTGGPATCWTCCRIA
ncbi:hypothetical protein BAE44_0012927 [Dichanthelium oligosanthes]|uniref:DUF7595 domain-containing protein n=1 Tax=Dichanthelium oligosanthes TaxID=888268 RepID=A0A1E5VLR3_9POAL|nr:hypothetical protein BAE44_0012927 [Dichanthelium oligosanthes]